MDLFAIALAALAILVLYVVFGSFFTVAPPRSRS